jgi:hypothetical protein
MALFVMDTWDTHSQHLDIALHGDDDEGGGEGHVDVEVCPADLIYVRSSSKGHYKVVGPSGALAAREQSDGRGL